MLEGGKQVSDLLVKVDEAEKKGTSSVALDVPFLTTWDHLFTFYILWCYFYINHYSIETKVYYTSEQESLNMFETGTLLRILCEIEHKSNVMRLESHLHFC